MAIDLDRKELLDEITYWESKISQNDEIIELAFFKIFVKFEKFIIEMFIKYATGQKSSFDYVPSRVLNFRDDRHLINVISINKDYIEINDRFIRLIDEIFEVDNPFTLFFTSSDRAFFDKAKCLRNYIAHESESSINKYKKITLDDKDFVTPRDYLIRKKNKRSSMSNYSYFVDIIKIYSENIVKISS